MIATVHMRHLKSQVVKMILLIVTYKTKEPYNWYHQFRPINKQDMRVIPPPYYNGNKRSPYLSISECHVPSKREHTHLATQRKRP